MAAYSAPRTLRNWCWQRHKSEG